MERKIPSPLMGEGQGGGVNNLIVCEEDPYLLELTRYIHLNPLRAGIVEDWKKLKRYPWGGHSALVGTVRREWQDTALVVFWA